MTERERLERALAFETALHAYLGARNRLFAAQTDRHAAMVVAGVTIHDSLQGLTWLHRVMETGDWPLAWGTELTPEALTRRAMAIQTEVDSLTQEGGSACYFQR